MWLHFREGVHKYLDEENTVGRRELDKLHNEQTAAPSRAVGLLRAAAPAAQVPVDPAWAQVGAEGALRSKKRKKKRKQSKRDKEEPTLQAESASPQKRLTGPTQKRPTSSPEHMPPPPPPRPVPDLSLIHI